MNIRKEENIRHIKTLKNTIVTQLLRTYFSGDKIA
jgi:hypothetical protein